MDLAVDIKRLSPASLAYLGDAVYELHVRHLLLTPPRRTGDYHRLVVSRVRATAQASALEALAGSLSEEEQAIVKRGRNQCGRIPKNVDARTYQQASGFESLLGYLYLSDPHRLSEILQNCDRVHALERSDSSS